MSDHGVIAAQPKLARKLMKSYIIGFVLALIYVCAAYAIVVEHLLAGESLYVGLAVLLVLEILVLVICFFRLNRATEDDRWNLITFIFTLIIMAIVVTGSLWIMYNLNYYMVN